MRPGPVVLTASHGAFPGLVEELRELPVQVEECPLLGFAPPLDWAPVDRALGTLSSYDALAFTSPRAAAAFVERSAAVGPAPPWSAEIAPPVWTSGAATTAALADASPAVHTVSSEGAGAVGAAAALATAMLDAGVAGPVLFPCGETRRDELPTRLRHEGVAVDEVICYRTVLADERAARHVTTRAAIVVVASPGVADLLARVSPPEARPRMLAVGPTTAAAARASGWPPAAIAARPEVGALVAGVRALLAD